MDIFNAELNDIHGGSLRLFIGREDVRDIFRKYRNIAKFRRGKTDLQERKIRKIL